MAGFDIEFPDDFLSGVLETDPQELCSEMLSEAAPLYVDSMKRSLRGVVDHEGDSEMVYSVKATKPKKTKTDAYIVNVGPSGYSKTKEYIQKDGTGKRTTRKYPVSNAVKAIWKEYGIPGKEPARPFLTKAKNDVENDVMNRMQEVYNRKVGTKK